MLKLKKRGGTWFIHGTTGPAGARRLVRESTGTDQRDLAEAQRVKREREIYEAAQYGERAVVTFGQAVEAFLARPGANTSKGDARRLGRLLGHFGTKKLSEIDQAAVDAAVAAICPQAKPATQLRAVIAPASAVLNLSLIHI